MLFRSHDGFIRRLSFVKERFRSDVRRLQASKNVLVDSCRVAGHFRDSGVPYRYRTTGPVAPFLARKHPCLPYVSRKYWWTWIQSFAKRQTSRIPRRSEQARITNHERLTTTAASGRCRFEDHETERRHCHWIAAGGIEPAADRSLDAGCGRTKICLRQGSGCIQAARLEDTSQEAGREEDWRYAPLSMLCGRDSRALSLMGEARDTSPTKLTSAK